MSAEVGFIQAIKERPDDESTRLIYADWLEDHDDPRCFFVRTHATLRTLPPDHPTRFALECDLSRHRQGQPSQWLAVIEPERAHLYSDPPSTDFCDCFAAGYGNRRWPQPRFHLEPQDTECSVWRRLLDEIEKAASDGREEFAPLEELSLEERVHIVTLPPTIAKLKAVRRLYLYGSYLVRLPPEIGEMTALEEFDPYTSYRLHWFPYEITRCSNLRDSTVSTRALYGNYKYRPPFPLLGPKADTGGSRLPRGSKARPISAVTRPCSVCGLPFAEVEQYRVWVSLRVATDVLPLLVNACSEECLQRLPTPPQRYRQGYHRGGVGLKQPSPE